MKPREDWWDYTKKIIRSYPKLERKLDSVGETPCVPAYGAGGGHGGRISNPVERAVVDRLTDQEQRRYDAVSAALEETGRMRDGQQRIRLIERVYFRRSHTLYGAAQEVPVSEITAKRWNGQFVRLVAEKLDLP